MALILTTTRHRRHFRLRATRRRGRVDESLNGRRHAAKANRARLPQTRTQEPPPRRPIPVSTDLRARTSAGESPRPGIAPSVSSPTHRPSAHRSPLPPAKVAPPIAHRTTGVALHRRSHRRGHFRQRKSARRLSALPLSPSKARRNRDNPRRDHECRPRRERVKDRASGGIRSARGAR